MIGHVFINGVIGSDEREKGVELIDIISQVKAYPSATSLVVNINSPGGYTKVGHAIADYLQSLSIPIDTIADVLCASIASRIFMVGQNRTIIQGTEFLIHNPWMATEGDADHMREAADFLEESEKELIQIYDSITNIGKEGIDGLMKTDTPMTAEKAYELGFATAIRPRMNAVAKYKIETKPELKTTMDNKQKSGFMKGLKALGDIMKDLAGLPPEKNMMVKSEDGQELELMAPDMSPATAVEPGVIVMVGGQPAAGTFVLPEQAVTIEVVDGVISAVNPIQDKTLETALAKITALEKENAELKASKEESEKNTALVETRIISLTESLNKIQSKHTPPTPKQEFGKPIQQTLSLKERIKERETQYKATK